MTGTSISSQFYNKDLTTSRNKNNNSNTDDIHSCVTPQKQNYSAYATSTTTNLTTLKITLSFEPVELRKTKKLPLAGKEYFYFQINRRSYHSAQCDKSWIMNKANVYILSIDIFEQQFVVIKGMLQSLRLEYHMKTIGIERSLFTRSSCEQKCLNNIKKIYQHAGEYDDQKKP